MTNEQLVLLIKDGVDISDNMLRLWEQNRAFIGKIAFSYRGYEDMDDLCQQGYIGLCQAVDGYKLGEAVPFINYAAFWIRQSMTRYIEDNGSVVRIPVHERQRQRKYKKLLREFEAQAGREPTDWEVCRCMGIGRTVLESIKANAPMRQIGSLDSYVGEDGDTTVGELVPGDADVESSVLDEIEQEELKQVLWPMVDALPGTQPQVIRSRYQEGKTLKAVGEVIGVNYKRVSAIEHEALRELRKRGCSVLAAFLPEAAAAMAYRHNGVGEFNRTWTSSTELVAMKMY